MKDWLKLKEQFEVKDVRQLKGNFLPSILKLLLSLSNGVGAVRMRQAVREFVNAYLIGTTTAEFDELFVLFTRNQGAGYFASEIGPSALFAAYK